MKLKETLRQTALWTRISHSMMYQRIRNRENYNRLLQEREFYRDLLKNLDGKLIFDVGANVGNKTDVFRRIARKVVAFEPNEACRRVLKARFWGYPVYIVEKALGSNESEQDYYNIDHSTAYSSLSKKHILTTVKDREVAEVSLLKPIQIQVTTLEKCIQRFGYPCYVKIDVEGYEVEVIKGLDSIVPLISFEVNLPEFKEEALQCIEHLVKISQDKYRFNFANDTTFFCPKPVRSGLAKQFLQTTSKLYVEVYAWT